MTNWRKEYRKCDRCRGEYRPKRQAQSYCSRECKRAAAYGRERFAAGTKGRRRRRLEASDKPLATPLPGSVRNGVFSSIETVACKPTTGAFDGPTMVWPERDFHAGPTPGALQGDDVTLEYYADGYPKLPACLDRRPKAEPMAEAA
jgi:hypothetical protein